MFRLFAKVWSIDPMVTNGDSMTPLSALVPAFARYRNDCLTTKPGQWPMGIIRTPGIII